MARDWIFRKPDTTRCGPKVAGARVHCAAALVRKPCHRRTWSGSGAGCKPPAGGKCQARSVTHGSLDAPVGHEPHERNGDVQRHGNPRLDESDGHAEDVDCEGEFALAIVP